MRVCCEFVWNLPFHETQWTIKPILLHTWLDERGEGCWFWEGNIYIYVRPWTVYIVHVLGAFSEKKGSVWFLIFPFSRKILSSKSRVVHFVFHLFLFELNGQCTRRFFNYFNSFLFVDFFFIICLPFSCVVFIIYRFGSAELAVFFTSSLSLVILIMKLRLGKRSTTKYTGSSDATVIFPTT